MLLGKTCFSVGDSLRECRVRVRSAGFTLRWSFLDLLMNERPSSPALSFYRCAARFSARFLAASGLTESILLRRSVATGEIAFGFSDIDMAIGVGAGVADDGEKLLSLGRRLRFLRRLNPRLGHVEVHEPRGIESLARLDTFWGSQERRSVTLLSGKPVEIPHLPVDPIHALGRFGLWVEWFVPQSIQQRSRRNLKKTAMEAWDAYVVAERLIEEPYLLRGEMEAHIRESEPDVSTTRLEEPSYASWFVFSLAERLHRSRLPALRELKKAFLFEAILAPLHHRRRFVVLPRADCALPPQAYEKGAFPCTPEALHLFLHYKNPFLWWALPKELRDLGMAAPDAAGFLRACRYYDHGRFLRHPGFVEVNPHLVQARAGAITHALDWLSRGEIPPALPANQLEAALHITMSCDTYYRTVFPRLRRECLERNLTQLQLGFSR